MKYLTVDLIDKILWYVDSTELIIPFKCYLSTKTIKYLLNMYIGQMYANFKN
jgi:hypothetical protein